MCARPTSRAPHCSLKSYDGGRVPTSLELMMTVNFFAKGVAIARTLHAASVMDAISALRLILRNRNFKKTAARSLRSGTRKCSQGRQRALMKRIAPTVKAVATSSTLRSSPNCENPTWRPKQKCPLTAPPCPFTAGLLFPASH